MAHFPRYRSKSNKYDRNYSNKILAKTISSNLVFNNRTFFNVNFRGSRLRKIKFNSCKFILCDFYGVILNKGAFSNVFFRKCIFYASIFRDIKFKNCQFDNCIFINMNTQLLMDCKMVDCLEFSYYDLKILDDINFDFCFTRKYSIFQKNRILHLKGGRINLATVFLVLQYMSYEEFILKLKYLCEAGDLKNICTTMRFLEILKNTQIVDIDKKT